jgi:lipopolysaccharide biosynthesis regulator YciM
MKSQVTALIVLLALPVSFATTTSTSAALDQALRFASAIASDPKDRSKAQQDVVEDFLALGQLDRAAQLVDSISLWRKGVTLANLATAYAKAGNVDSARQLLTKAETFRGQTQGWEGVRIDAHIAQAHAALGDVDRARQIATRLSQADNQYAGRDRAIIADGLAAQAKYDEAISEVSSLDAPESDVQIAWWRTAGYISLARQKKLAVEKRLEALSKALESSADIDGWKRAEVLNAIAEEYRLLGRSAEGEATLRVSQHVVDALGDDIQAKPALLSNLARAWGKFDAKQRSQELLQRAEPIAQANPELDRPTLLASLAGGYASIGDANNADRIYRQALTAAEGLVNARPRALAVVQVLRSMGRNNVPLTSTVQTQLERLFQNLKAPW